MAKYRQKRKQEGMKESRKSTVTRSSCEKQRQKWRGKETTEGSDELPKKETHK
jgi:hypothetical protein